MALVALGFYIFLSIFVFWFMRSHEIIFTSNPDATMAWLVCGAIAAIIAGLVALGD